MTNVELLTQCKIGLGVPSSVTVHDAVITQKIVAVKSYLTGAGVSETMLDDDLAVGVIVLGVTDLWNLNSGDIKFSLVFNTLLTQLVSRSETTV